MGFFDRSKEKLFAGIFGGTSTDHIRWERTADGETVVHKVEDEDFPDGSDLIVGSSQAAVLTNGVDMAVFTEAGLSQLWHEDLIWGVEETDWKKWRCKDTMSSRGGRSST